MVKQTEKRQNAKSRLYTVRFSKPNHWREIEFMDSLTSVSGYLKSLIRQDMFKRGLETSIWNKPEEDLPTNK